jgi:hypothetical protein
MPARTRLSGQVSDDTESGERQREVFRRSKPQRELSKQRRDEHQTRQTERARDERSKRRNSQRRSGAAAERHLIAIQTCHDGRCFAGNIQQY